MGQNLPVPLDSTVDLGQHHFLRKKNSNVQTFTVDHYLELSRLIFRCISNYPDGLSFGPRFFELF